MSSDRIHADVRKSKRNKDNARIFAYWLGAEAARCGWSFHDLARRCGLSASALGKALGNGSRPTWELCVRLGHALRLSPVTVFRKAGLLPAVPQSGEERLAEVFDALAVLPEGPIRREAGEAIWAVVQRACQRAGEAGGRDGPSL